MVSKVLFQIFMVEMLIILFMLQMKWLNKSYNSGGFDTFKKSSFKVWHMKKVHKLTCIFTDFVNIYGHTISDRHKPQSFPYPTKGFLSGIIQMTTRYI